MISHVDEDLFNAIVRSISTVEVNDEQTIVAAAFDSLHALARWFHTSSRSFALIVRNAGKRVLATSCDHEFMSNNNTVDADDATARSCAIANLCGEKLSARSRTSDFLDDIEEGSWFEESKPTRLPLV